MAELPVSAKIEAKVGERSTDKLIDVLVDTFSPASETLGLLGDAIRLARVEVATRVALRAKEKAEKAGLRLVAPPFKFLVPFFEKASIESESDDEMQSLWANLLVSAATNVDQLSPIFIDILSKLRGVDAKVFEDIMSHEEFGTATEESIYRYNEYWFPDRAITHRKQPWTAGSLSSFMEKYFDYPGVLKELIVIDTGGEYYEDEGGCIDKMMSLHVLSSLNLIARVQKELKISNYSCIFIYWHATELGLAFWEAVSPKHQD